MASLTNNNAMEMQYKPAEPMQASPSIAAAQEIAHTTDCESQQPKKERTFLGMRGGGILRTYSHRSPASLNSRHLCALHSCDGLSARES
ncbi:hypothetical protein LTR35_003329 [Friedmanniomyces endolithicus]|uniref:Uncharacterized protein n=1 Tax=Friedmanniomyces endolithicus TaxID=329885 RepID=A0AAN6FFH4_9PEZI|nr:hypothetical protein LTS00_012907 [Friedmanniomyces endolithicus]KAK0288928.1 hypothetical protein LTR35_003329 [Friedmanniomyces endolithicus]KAK0317472.1 hypothetical protein LTR82_011510 [Friedmanniomyces endolithicus]KAK1006166.1 hypothetical protein LTR54_006689 [Friedmanniomyces endolithicus]